MHPVESQNKALTDGWTDRQTDGQTDRQTDGCSNISVLGATPMLLFHRVLWDRKVVLGASQCNLNVLNLFLDAKITP